MVTIEDFKKSISGFPKDDKINFIKQTLINRTVTNGRPMRGIPHSERNNKVGISENNDLPSINTNSITEQNTVIQLKSNEPEYSPTNEQLKHLLKEIESNYEAYESNTSRKELIPFMFDRDLNWYYNPKNISNTDLVFETVNFIENERNGLFVTIDFLNLIYWHYLELQNKSDKPFDYILHIKNIHLNEVEKHLLVAMILKWYGGIPFELHNSDKWKAIKRLLQEEFWRQLNGEETKEKKYVLKGIQYSVFPAKYEYWDIDNTIFAIEVEKKENKYNIQNVKDHLETIIAIDDKIQYLLEIKKEYQQNKGANNKFETVFNKQCDLEIKKLIELKALEYDSSTPVCGISHFKLLKKHGVRINFIRIINALYELKYIELPNGQTPNKLDFMKKIGEFFGQDLSKYDTDLSQAMNTTGLEANLKVFEEMKSVTQNKHTFNKI